METLKHDELLSCAGGTLFLLATKLVIKIVNNIQIALKGALKWNV